MTRQERAEQQRAFAHANRMGKGCGSPPDPTPIDMDKIIPPFGLRAIGQRAVRTIVGSLTSLTSFTLGLTPQSPAIASRGPVEPGCVVNAKPIDPNQARTIDGGSAFAFQEVTGPEGSQISNAPSLVAVPKDVGGVTTELASGAAKAAIFKYEPDLTTGAKPSDCPPGTPAAIDEMAKAVQAAFGTGMQVQVMEPVIGPDGQPTGKFRAVGTAPRAQVVLPLDRPADEQKMRSAKDTNGQDREQRRSGGVCKIHLVGDSMVNPDNPITDSEGKNAVAFGQRLTQALGELRAGLNQDDVSVVQTAGYLTGTNGAHSTINGVRAPVFFSYIDRWTYSPTQPDLGKIAVLSLTRNDASQFVLDPQGFEDLYFSILLRMARDKNLETVYAIANQSFDDRSGPPHNLRENLPHIINAQVRAIQRFRELMKSQGRSLNVIHDTLDDFQPEDYELNPVTGRREVHFNGAGVRKLARRMVDATRQAVCLPDLPKQPTTIILSSILNNVEIPEQPVEPIGRADEILKNSHESNSGTQTGELWNK